MISLFLELQSRATRGFGQRLDPTVVGKPPTIEDDRFDPRFQRPFGDRLADGRSALRAGVRLDRLAQGAVRRRGCRQRPPRGVIDDLRIDMMQAAEHRQPWPLGPALEVGAQPDMTANPCAAAIGNLVHYFAAPAVFPVLPALRRTRSPR